MAFRGDLDALILAILSDGPKHGYEISKRIKELSNKALAYGEGQLYPALHKMEEGGDILANWVPQEGKPPRKVYVLTDAGSAQLQKKKIEWTKFQESVSSIMGVVATTGAKSG